MSMLITLLGMLIAFFCGMAYAAYKDGSFRIQIGGSNNVQTTGGKNERT